MKSGQLYGGEYASTVASQLEAKPTAQKRHILARHGHVRKFSTANMAAPMDSSMLIIKGKSPYL